MDVLPLRAVLVVLYNKHGESLEEFLGEVHISLAAYKHFKVIDDWYALEDLVSFFIINVSPCFYLCASFCACVFAAWSIQYVTQFVELVLIKLKLRDTGSSNSRS